MQNISAHGFSAPSIDGNISRLEFGGEKEGVMRRLREAQKIYEGMEQK